MSKTRHNPVSLAALIAIADDPPKEVCAGLGITRKQGKVLGLVWGGKENKEIAGVLKISLSTLRGHLDTLKRKFKARNTKHLIGLTLPQWFNLTRT